MTILYYFADKGTFMEEWQYIHFIDELKHHNVNIEVFNPLSFRTIEEANSMLVKILTQNPKYDLFMNCCPDILLFRSTMMELSHINIPKLLICFDNLHAPFLHLKIAKYFDLVWLTSFENVDLFKKSGAKVIFLPYASNPYKFIPDYKENINHLCFIGRPYGSRILKISQLSTNGIPCDLFFDLTNTSTRGQIDFSWNSVFHHLSFPIGRKILQSRLLRIFKKNEIIETNSNIYQFPSLSFSEMVNTYANHSLSLNILELRNTYLLKKPIYKLHLRTFEIPMSGGLQFTTYNEELAEYFEEDKEIIFYRSYEDMIDKAKFYLNKNVDCYSLKQAAHKRALVEHTWWNRFKTVFGALNIHEFKY